MVTAEYVENFRRRVLQDALTQATASHWRRRADQLEAARPVLGEYYGGAVAWPGDPLPAGATTTGAPVEELRKRWIDLTETALACRRRADLLTADRPEGWDDEIADALEEAG